jgi:superfamily II DNA or RNA helicase
MSQLIFEPINAVRARIRCEESIAREIYDAFTFEAPGHKFHPAYKAGYWDGKIRMLDLKTRTIYRGLEEKIKEYCKRQEYQFFAPEDEDRIEGEIDFSDYFLDVQDKNIEPRDYQWEAVDRAARRKRQLFLSPTSSGKSLIIYMIASFYGDKKTLLIVPRSDLVEQMYGDFRDYGCDVEKECHRISKGVKDTDKRITITTWQAIQKMPEEWYEQFEMVLGDEVHGFTAKSLTHIMECLKNCEYRYGFTGTLSGAKTAELTLVGLFGPVMKVTTTADLQAKGHVSQLSIDIVILEHPKWVRDLRKNKYGPLWEYDAETKWVIRVPARNNFLKNLALHMEKNTLILFRFVEKHGKILYDLMKDEGQEVYFIHGGVKGTDRNDIRGIMEKGDKIKAVASYGVFSTGTNIKNLFNIIFASGWKSKILNLQSIGRVLRLFEEKTAKVYDVADDMSYRTKKGKVTLNHGMKHLRERIKIYEEEGFDYTIHRVRLDYGPGEVPNEEKEDGTGRGEAEFD